MKDKKISIKESFNLGKGWQFLMIFAILAMLVTNAGVNDGLNVRTAGDCERCGP